MKQGLVTNLSHEDYLETDALSSSMAKVLAYQSPAHFKAYMDEPSEQTEAMRFGTAFHKIMESEDAFFQSYVKMPKVDKRTKEGKAAYENALEDARSNDKELLDEEQFSSLLKMRDSLKASEIARGLLAEGIHEASGFWQDEETGVWCKIRPDFISDNCIIDFKTARSIDKWHKTCADFRYDFQAAWYLHGLKILTGIDRPFIHIAIETKAPFSLIIRAFSQEWIDLVTPKIKEAMQKYKVCSEGNYWPGPSDSIQEMLPPFWKMSEQLE